MRTLALDPVTGDLAISNGRLRIAEGAEAVRQALALRLSIWQGEWFADTTVGIPYRGFLGVKGTVPFAEAQLRRAISTCPGVATLERFTFAVDERRRAVCTFEVTTIDGEPVTVTDYVAGDS